MKKYKFLRKLQATGVALLLAIGTMVAGIALATPAHAATLLGSVNIQTYGCDRQAVGSVADLLPFQNNVYAWRCFYHNGGTTTYVGVNLNDACNAQYGGGAWANYLDYNNPYSWRCYR